MTARLIALRDAVYTAINTAKSGTEYVNNDFTLQKSWYPITKLEELAELELAYPTFTAIVGLAARRLVRELGLEPMAPQWRALRRHYFAEWERRDD